LTDTIFLIENVSTESLETQIKKYEQHKIFCLSYSSHKNLKQIGIQHEIGEYSLTDKDKKIIDQMTLDATTNWYNHKELQNYLLFKDINLGSLIELELLHYFLSLYRNAITIMRIIEIEKPSRIVTSSYLNDFVKQLCREKSITVIEITEIQQPELYGDKINIKFNFGNKPLSFHISRNTFLKLRKFIQKSLNVFFNFTPDYDSKQQSILLIDFNPVIFDDLLSELSKSKKNILLLNQRRPAIWNLDSFKIVKKSNSKIVDLGHFEKFLSFDSKTIVHIFLQELSKMWNLDSIFNKIFEINSIPFWGSIKNSFIKTCNQRFEESLHRILLLEKFFEKTNISSILEWAETGQEEKELLHVSRKKNIKSFMLQHNLFPYSLSWLSYERFVIGFSYPFLSSKQIIWDSLTNEQAIISNTSKENILLLGSPKHDKFFKSKINKSKGIILLATTAPTNISIEMSPFESYEKFESFIREVCHICKQIPNKQLIVKPHPQADYYTNITELIKEIDPAIQIIYDADLVELIGSCDLLITFNNSTIALESIILDKPTISLQFEKWAEEDKIVKTDALMSISELSDVEKGINEMLFDSNIQNKFKQNRKSFLKLFVNPGSSSNKIAKFLEDL
jgi:hypothetical protein